MYYDFSANEMFEMAIRIEEEGAQFYRKAAEFQSEEENRSVLENLATMEDFHKQTFEEMRENLSATEKTATGAIQRTTGQTMALARACW